MQCDTGQRVNLRKERSYSRRLLVCGPTISWSFDPPAVLYFSILITSNMCTARLTCLCCDAYFGFCVFSHASRCAADTLWVTQKFLSVCSRALNLWSMPSPCMTSAVSTLTTLWAKSPADSASTNCHWTRMVSVKRNLRFMGKKLKVGDTILSPHLCNRVPLHTPIWTK